MAAGIADFSDPTKPAGKLLNTILETSTKLKDVKAPTFDDSSKSSSSESESESGSISET